MPDNISPLLHSAVTLADTIEARLDADDPLAPAEQRAVANTIRSIVNDWRPVAELADGLVEDARLVARDARVVSLRPGLAVIAGGLVVV